ncbi:hypothetical protein LAZ67_17002555, partial [Cordylochernes scorpioides]
MLYLEATEKATKPDKLKVAILLNFIGEEALEVFNTFHLKEDEAENFDLVINKFDDFCEPKKNVIFERFKFFSATQKDDESIDSFITELKGLSTSCEFESQKDSSFRDRIVYGIQDKALQERLLREPNLTLLKAIEMCKTDEISKQQIKIMQNSQNICQIRKYEKKHSPKQNQESEKEFKCQRCGKSHRAKNCPAWGKRCSKCKKMNHFSAFCKSSAIRSLNDETEETVWSIHEAKVVHTLEWKKSIIVNGKEICFKLDSGAEQKIPFSIREKVKAELERMEKLDIIEKVEEPSKWTHPIVVVQKPSGDVRICMDPRELNTLEENNVKLNTKKQQIAVDKVNFLGHIISRDGIAIQASRAEAIQKLKRPENKTEVQRFLVFGCERFQYYIWGNDVIVETDHKPLLSIVKKPLEKLSPRLQRMVLRLMRFQISLKFTPGKNMFVADHLSRDPLKDEVDTSYLEGQTESVQMLLVTTDEKNKETTKGNSWGPHLDTTNRSGRDPNLALMEFNNTPKYDLPSPTQMLMGRSVRTLSTYSRQQLKPLFDTTKNYQKLRDHQQKYAGSPKRILRPLEVGYNIMLQEWHRKWVPATVTVKHETPRSYMVKTPSGSEYRRNRSHLRPRKFSVEDSAPTIQSPSIPGSQAGTAMDDTYKIMEDPLPKTEEHMIQGRTLPRKVKNHLLLLVCEPAVVEQIKEVYRRNKRLVGMVGNKIHVDPTLEDSDKFQYLVQSMSPGTRASKLVDSYPLTAEKYSKVIETLTERFGRPELLQQVYVRDLIRLMIDCSSKQQLKVTSFYDELVTHLRALESLKIEARQMSVFIFPMIEACLSEELMKAWQRSPLHDVKIDANDSTQTRVDLIMEFLQKEAAAEQDRALAGSKFGLRSLKQDRNVGRQSHPAKIPTAFVLFAGRAQNCILCNKDHKNTECLTARRMSIKERRERIKNAKCCFSCLQPGHISSNCRRRITECIRCKKKHLDILCPLNAHGRESADEDKEQVEDCDVSPTVENGVSFSGLSASSLILLQTLKIKVEGLDKRDNQLGTFVANRVKEICRLSDPGNLRYVPSECNPADLPSRGCSLSRLIQSTWWEGPSWLKLSKEFWPSRYKDLNEEEICVKRMLRTSTLTYHQLMTLLCHTEAVMNGRSMTYVSDDPNGLVSISPSVFLQEQTDVEFPECQNMGSNPTTQKLRYLSKLREELKSRFRKEYLSLLVQRNRRIYNPKLQAGDVVLVGMDNKSKTFTYVFPRVAAERDFACTETFDFSTPNEWPKCRKRFERYLVVSGMKKKEEADKIDLFMYLMGDRADDIFKTFKFEKEEEATKIDFVLKAFDSHFCVRKNIIYERAKFNSRIQEDREPVDEFITSLYKLADSCEFEGLHEQLIRDRIVVGVRDKALSERMQLDSELTLEKAVKMVRQQEAVRQQQVDLQRPSTSQKVNQVKFNSKKQSPKQQQQPSRKKEKSAKTRSRCPKCGGFTHREGQACRAEGQKCNLCSKTGHFANCCPDKQAKTAEVKAVSELDEEIGFLLEVSAVEDSSNLDDDEGECRRRWTAEIQVNGKQEKIYVIRRLSEPLLSRRACELLNLARRIEVVATRINPIKEFPEVFEGLGQIGNPYEIKLKPGAKPYAVHTPRRVPIPLMEKLKTRLDIPGKELLDADALSRQPLLTTEGGEDERPTSAHINAVLSCITDKDEMLTKNFEAQQEDTTLKAVVNYLGQGWPDKKKLSQALLSYWHVKDELGVQNGLLMRSCRLVIPASMKLEILDKLHAGHFGITKTRLRARETVWWPGISEENAETVRKCSVCIQEAVSKHEPLIPTNFPTRPWQKIGMDLFKFENKWYLVVIDYYSRFPEMIQLDRLTASVVVRSCKSIFARHGIPETVVSDNGTQFGAAREFANFARQYGFTHVTSSPRFPQSNGMAEAGSGTKSCKRRFDCQTAAFYERELTEEVEKIREVVRQTYLSEQEEARIKFENKRLRTFNNGDLVLVERMHETKGRHKFEPRYGGPYEVLKKTGDTVYLLKNLEIGNLDKYHIDSLKQYHVPIRIFPTEEEGTNDGNLSQDSSDEDHWIHLTGPAYLPNRSVNVVVPQGVTTRANSEVMRRGEIDR